jgi:2-oxoglutarate dehydrogenase E2 component (dihydrolipoamide succinyltransferase)
MPTKVIMPQLGESVVEGTVTRWLKAEGDSVEEFEALLEVNTDKVDTEIPAPASGKLLKLYVPEGTTVGAGTLLAVIGQQGDDLPEAEAASSEGGSGSVGASAPPSSPVAGGVEEPARADLGFISPVVARLAREHNLDLHQVRGTGTGGRITKKDVLTHLESRPAAPWESPSLGELFRPTEEVFGDVASDTPGRSGPSAGELIQLDAVRRAIAEHMLRSKATSPHVTTVMEADMRRVVAHRLAHREAFAREGVNLTYTAYFAAACVSGLRAVPMVNASWTEQGVRLHAHIHLGIAVSLGEQGLIVPVIKDAGQKSLLGLAQALGDLAGRARTRKLQPDEVQGGTFTITNHGVSGSLFATPIINQPQTGILGVGALQKRVVAVESRDASGTVTDSIAIRPMLYLTLTFDHRILDGALADAFLGKVVETLQTWGP